MGTRAPRSAHRRSHGHATGLRARQNLHGISRGVQAPVTRIFTFTGTVRHPNTGNASCGYALLREAVMKVYRSFLAACLLAAACHAAAARWVPSREHQFQYQLGAAFDVNKHILTVAQVGPGVHTRPGPGPGKRRCSRRMLRALRSVRRARLPRSRAASRRRNDCALRGWDAPSPLAARARPRRA